MKTAIIFADGLKQVVFTPENDQEELALAMFGSEDNVKILVKSGSFSDDIVPVHATVSKCQGGYLRMYRDAHSKIFVIEPKTKD